MLFFLFISSQIFCFSLRMRPLSYSDIFFFWIPFASFAPFFLLGFSPLRNVRGLLCLLNNLAVKGSKVEGSCVIAWSKSFAILSTSLSFVL